MNKLGIIFTAMAVLVMMIVSEFVSKYDADNQRKVVINCMNNKPLCEKNDPELFNSLFPLYESIEEMAEANRVVEYNTTVTKNEVIDEGALVFPSEITDIKGNKLLYSLHNSLTKDIVRDYYLKRGIDTGKTMSDKRNNVLLYKVINGMVKNDDMVFFIKNGKERVGVYYDNVLSYSDNCGTNITRYNDVDIILSINRLIEKVNKSKFVKTTSILETNNKHIVNKYYYGRYQIAKRYLPYYMKRLSMVPTKTPSEYQMRKIVSLIFDDSVKFIVKNKLPMTRYTIRMVYMLGRSNVNKFRSGKLPNNIIRDNLPKKYKANDKTLAMYWNKKIADVYGDV